MSAELSPDERARVAPFFTNTTDPVFGLRLPQEVAGALFSRYSRSTKQLRRIFLDEFLGHADLGLVQPTGQGTPDALEMARAFYDRVLVGYGDDSVAQLGGAHIACENVSNVGAKLLEDARIGIAPLEKSTRYVRFDAKGQDGEYLFYRDAAITDAAYGDAYLGLMRRLFETYASQLDPMIAFVGRSMPIESVEWKHPQTGEPLTYKQAATDPRLTRWAQSAYRATVRAHACDILRSYLPAATLTNVGLFGSGQAFEHLLGKLYSHELAEAQGLATGMHAALNALIPSFVKRAAKSDYLAATFAGVRALANRVLAGRSPAPSNPVTLVDYDDQAEDRVVAAILYPHARLPLRQLRELLTGFSAEARRTILDEYLSRRRHRRDKPGRALEQVSYTFDLVGNLGAYRDLQRHRLLSQERQDFTTTHGYDTPHELEEAGFLSVFRQRMIEAAELYDRIHCKQPLQAQYVVPFAYRIRWYMKMNLREAVHFGELRTMPQGHPDYRLLVQEMWRQIQGVHPGLAHVAKFIDWGTYRLGRLQSEIRSEYKRSTLDD